MSGIRLTDGQPGPATQTELGLVIQATDAEVAQGLNTGKYVTPAALATALPSVLGLGTAAFEDFTTAVFNASDLQGRDISATVPTDGQALVWNLANSRWQPGTVSTTVGTVTSVNASGGTTGLSFSGGPVTTSGTLTLAGTLAVANGGTGATDNSGARTNLGLAIGTNVQAYDAGLASIAGLTTSADQGIYTTAADTYATFSLTSAGRALLDDVDAAAQRTTLGLGSIATQAASSVSITGGSITGITDLAVADGGTGASTAADARDNLLPDYTGNVGKVLTVNSGATDVEWTTNGAGTVTSVDVSGGTTGLTTSGGPVTASGTITLAGTLAVSNGGTGASTLTGYVKGTGTSALTASGTIPNTDITGLGSMSTQNSSSVSITGGSITGITDLAVADGGTGASDASGARANLVAAVLGANGDITSLTGVTGGISSPDFVQFDTAAAASSAVGKLFWNDADGAGTLSVGLKGGNVVHNVGQETFYRVKASAAISKGQVVMFSGVVGGSGQITGAPATGLTPSQGNYVIGVAAEGGALNDWVLVSSFGFVRGFNTTGGAESWVAGDSLYYNPAVAGGLTKVIPNAPNPRVEVAAVISADASTGEVLVRVTHGSELGGTDSNVQVGTLADNDFLVYNLANARWQNYSAAASRTALSLVVGTDVQAYDAGLTSIAGLTTSADQGIYTTATDTYATFSLTSAGRALLDDVDAAAQRTTLGLAIGTNVQAYDAGLASIAGLTTSADQGIYTTAADTYATFSLTSAGRALLDDVDAAAQRTTLGLGSIATQAASSVSITGGSITGITDLAVADGGTGASTAADARVNLLPSYTGNGSKVLSLNSGATDVEWATPSGGGGTTYVVKTANYTMADLEGVLANTSAGSFTVTLPATPSVGSQCIIADDADTFGTNNLTVGRNGSTIEGTAADLVLDISGVSVQFVYSGTTWNVYAQIGGNGGTAVTLDGVQTITNKTFTTGNAFNGTLGATTPSTGVFTTLSDAIGDVRLLPQNSQSTAYTLVLADSGKHLLHPSADTTARTFTIPANGSVAYPIGTAITFVNQASAGVLTIAITTDTMRLAGAGTTGSRTLAANGIATALKVTSTEWIISGTGLT